MNIRKRLWNIKYLIRNIQYYGFKQALTSSIFANIPSSTIFVYSALGVVIGINVKLGEKCIIHQNVTIGSKNGKSPVIGDNVEFFPFCVVCGDITIGDNVTIGAFSYVDKDIPPNSLVYGIPAKIIR